MKGRLEPIQTDVASTLVNQRKGDTFAILGRAEMIALTRAMRDAQSAVLFCLAWHTALQERMRQGPFAGRRVARVSTNTLAKITRRPTRTVKYALSRLKAANIIEREDAAPGRTSIYRLRLDEGQPSGSMNEIDPRFDVSRGA